MGLFGVLLISFGAFGVATAAGCVPETAICSEYWEKLLPHENLISSEAELDSWCSAQVRFYEYLESVLLEGKNGNLSDLPTDLLITKLYSEDLCSEGSTSRTRLLNNADCINQLNTEFCILPEYLDEIIPSARSSEDEKFSCIAATIVSNCGFDAGRAYRTMLKITRYSAEVCGIETSEGIPCEGSKAKSGDKDKLSEIYYGLFHKIGDMLNSDEDQNETEDSISDEMISDKTIENDGEDDITEAIQTAIENLEENLILEELDIPEYVNSIKDSQSIPCSKIVEEYKPYMKNPIITEVFKEFLFYNYSGLEYAMYWRQPLFSITDKINCEHLLPSYMKVDIFKCKLDYRYNDPDCVSNATVYEKVTPEFIRSFDPEVPCESTIEFGPHPEWMSELDKMYENTRIREQTKSSQFSTVTEAPEMFATSSTLLHLTTSAYPENDKSKKWHKYDLKANNMNSLVPNDIFNEMRDLVWPDFESFESPRMNRIRIGDSMFLIMYDPEFAKSIENITCNRIDECHPRGRGVWKCKVRPRKIDTCDTCGKYQTENTTIDVESLVNPAETSDASFTIPDTTESMTVDESVVLQNSTPFIEQIALVFSGDAETENQMAADHPESEADDHPENEAEMNLLDSFMNEEANLEDSELEETDETEYDLSDSDLDEVRLQILHSALHEDSESSEIVYKIEDDAEDEDSQVIIATEDGLIAGNILVLKNVSDLDETKYTLVSVPASQVV